MMLEASAEGNGPWILGSDPTLDIDRLKIEQSR